MARSDALLRLHKTLSARRTELRKRLGMELADLGVSKGSAQTGDAADAAFGASGEEIASQLAELESKELAQVERALRRLKQGTYGKCEGCNCNIPLMRLNALPYSTMCITCQREREQHGYGRGEYGGHDYARISDSRNPMEDREVNIADLEMDMTKS
jgi:DnaK suppressor protein